MTEAEINEVGARFAQYVMEQPPSVQGWIGSAPDLESVAPLVKGALSLAQLPTSEEMEKIEHASHAYAFSLLTPEQRRAAPPSMYNCVIQHRSA